jgi:PAS domain-containing protein
MTTEKMDLSRLWQQMFDAIPDLVIVLDPEHRILWLNSAMASRLKTSREMALGSRCFQLLHDADQPPPGCPHCLMLRSGASHTLLGVLFLDLDHFKPVNDSFGHDTGDLLLAEVARRMREAVRETDTIGRLG